MTRWWWVRHAPVPDPRGRITGQLDLRRRAAGSARLGYPPLPSSAALRRRCGALNAPVSRDAASGSPHP
ncbi:hypothetical protein GALL_88090 [mine drainage metagenome]|uniref:Histidine phosphatase family protein n=1 Tax=mine drainage metagenome TaxID=410659 RepID=A0A1J5SL56_9ZZZZ